MKKRKFFKIVLWTGGLGAIILCLYFSFFAILWQIKLKKAMKEGLSPQTRMILFHLYGIKNMTREEKKSLLFGKIDTTLVDLVFPDQDPKFAIDSSFVIRCHLERGNPEINIGWARSYESYYSPKDGIFLSPFSTVKGKLQTIFLDYYFSELAHAEQFSLAPIKSHNRWLKGIIESLWLQVIFRLSFYDAYQYQYQQKGSLEYEAHQIIKPRIIKDYLDRRRLYFDSQLNEIEKEIAATLARIKQTGKEKEKNAKKIKDLLSRRDSLLYGGLLIKPD